jgi:hypothetical protein
MENFYRQKYRQKISLGVDGQKYGIAPTLILQGFARAGDRSR